MRITRTDPVTKRTHTAELPVTAAQIRAWQDGELAQVAFASLNADQREFIVTGIVSKSWSWIFEKTEDN